MYQQDSYQYSERSRWGTFDLSQILQLRPENQAYQSHSGSQVLSQQDHQNTLPQTPIPGIYIDHEADESRPLTEIQTVTPAAQVQVRPHPRIRIDQEKGQGTKNMLPYFKKAHRQFLIKFIEAFPEYRLIKENKNIVEILLNESNKISMREYEIIYGIPQLSQCWKTMFIRHKYLYQHLMLGKASKRQKIAYLKKIGCFERAFKSGKFEYIN